MSKQKSQYIVSPTQYLKKAGISFKCPHKVFIVYSKTAQDFVSKNKFLLEEGWRRGNLYKKGNLAILVGLGLGSAPLNLAMEELYTLGAQEFTLIGFAGGINGNLSPGDIVNSEKHNIYSTDDPYGKETKAWLNYMKRSYVDAVDMETQALKDKGYKLGIKTKSYLVVLDLITKDSWNNDYDTKMIKKVFSSLLEELIK